MIFYFIRHAEPVYNPDILTEKGNEQANALVERLLIHKIDKVFTSSSGRAVLTAKPFCEKANIEPVLLDWATEDLAGRDFSTTHEMGGRWLFDDEEVLRQFNTRRVAKLGDLWYKDKFFLSKKDYSVGVERINNETDALMASLGILHNRKKRTYKNMGQKYERVAFFAHSGFGMAFLSSLLDIPYPIMCLHIQHSGFSGVTAIWFDETKKDITPRIVEYSNDSHLFKADIKPYHYLDI